ncbi:DUF1127 domain-containing protein [Ancylobacter pratisalsi]|uniref:DUF1127 domain-containing protein n=1 Tax=Ancylobacter pratisalsi TaxID=1745854 RepID=UPI001FE62021|nr:DUF1127 domain-containing protein [Ancylobacter pratisalsi]
MIAVASGSIRIFKAFGRRRLIAELGEFDDHMLRDIGLTRSDLRDASSGPVWQDPTSVLVVRAVERRASRRALVREAQPVTGAKARTNDVIACR